MKKFHGKNMLKTVENKFSQNIVIMQNQTIT